MPAIPEMLVRRAGEAMERVGATVAVAEREVESRIVDIVKRINVPYNSTSPAGLIAANTVDPWNKSGKYALGWVYFCIILLVITAVLHYYFLFTDKIRTAMRQEEVLQSSKTSSPDTDYELSVLTDKSTNKFFPRQGELPKPPPQQPTISGFGPFNNLIALFRYIFYHPIPAIRIKKGWRPIVLPSLGALIIIFAALVFVTLYCFVPQPLYWQSIAFGSPPLAIRAGMIAVAMMPWVIALAMKANFISLITGIGPERLNVLHRWAAYIMLFLSLVHTIPFYVTPIWDKGGVHVFKSFFKNADFYVYGTGIAALVPLCFLCVHSIAWLRHKAYELFTLLHVPVAIVYLAMLFWHCQNYLTSWHYLFSTLAIWLASYILRLFYLNWTKPWKQSAWLVGDEAAVTILPENAVKVTIPTQMKWRPGQFVYLRMPGVSVFENHPFTIASLCSDDFPSVYGEGYRDMVIVFRPFGGFTKRVVESAMEHGPWHTYRAFVDGPYGGMNRRIEAFDNVVLIAGGSGITAIVSQLLYLIKRMRDGKAVTKHVQVIWAMKRPETLEWFKEELRICREYAPPQSVQCQFYITTAVRGRGNKLVSAQTPSRPMSIHFHDKVNEFFDEIADKRGSGISSKRHSALIREEAAGNPDYEKELRREQEDAITALPQAHTRPVNQGYGQHLTAPQPTRPHSEKRHSPERDLSLDISVATQANPSYFAEDAADNSQAFDFGFPSTPTEFQKNLMRFAFLPAASKKRDGWSTEYGRPDIPFQLKEASKEWGRRTCVFVCGPPTMRIAVSDTVADLQKDVWSNSERDEIFLHAENYAL